MNLIPRAAGLAAALLLAACAQRVAPPPVAATPAEPATAVQAGVAPGPGLKRLLPADAAPALRAFRISCPSLRTREDASGLTLKGDWDAACAAAEIWPDAQARRFFLRHFRAARVGSGQTFATGYYEPQIRASRVRAPGYEAPVYRRPPDLVEADVVDPATGKARKRRGLVVDGQLQPYHDRAAIVGGALAGKGLELAWAADPIELFFLQIQGSGRLLMPDGSVMRIGYDGQNGRDYTAIGRVLRERGVFAPGQATMANIIAHLRSQPDGGASVMNENASWVFFRELTGPGPLGALGRPVTPRASVAADPAFVPLGAPVVLDLADDRADGLWVAQDTGGAIKGANRFDTFWGAGEEAAAISGGLSASGTALLLLPKASFKRLRAGSRDGGAPAQR
ncbi:MAG: GH102 [uncultured Sphingomonadaceae bacterium]|uniref:peptidoglycan lytic exotransglycosylase n=1 Tax=uncultured Sphingomonadaceae bacterium TaxID=169976 RepID=A0A6J4TGZ2_9SPHN|nr:MAG: GH102 [uncultured Sphingomonadaceae bacterium]